MTSRVVIVGGAEFIGTRLASWLKSNSSAAVVLLDEPSRSGFVPKDIHFQPINLSSRQALRGHFTAADVVINCVAGKAADMLGSASAVFDVAKHLDVRLIQLSTMAAYGSAVGKIDESSPLLGDVDDYSAARAKIDQMAELAGFVRLRPGIIYGPGSVRWSLQIGRLLRARRLGDLGEAGDGIANLLYIDDLLRVIQLAIERPDTLRGALNLRGKPVSWNEYLVQYACVLDATPVRRIPARALRFETRFLAPAFKLADMTVGRLVKGCVPELLPPSMVRVFGQSILLDVTKAETELKMSWTELSDGLEAAANWVKNSK